MITEQAKKQLFLSQMKSIRTQEFTNLLRCPMCRGLYRFAHTLVDCGHTFCQFCLFSYIKSFKGRNPSVKCPQCNAQIDSNYNRSIMKDVYKQNLVDILQPSYVSQEQKIIQRVKRLFPEEDLEFLLDEFKFSQYDFPLKRKKNEEKNLIMGKLVQNIKNKLNISFQTFVQQITDQKRFTQFQAIILKKTKKDKLIEVRPRSQRQEQFVGINHKMKSEGLTPTKLIRFIEKKALERIKTFPEETLKQFLNPEKTQITIKVELNCQNFKLDPQTDLSECNQPISYILR